MGEIQGAQSTWNHMNAAEEQLELHSALEKFRNRSPQPNAFRKGKLHRWITWIVNDHTRWRSLISHPTHPKTRMLLSWRHTSCGPRTMHQGCGQVEVCCRNSDCEIRDGQPLKTPAAGNAVRQRRAWPYRQASAVAPTRQPGTSPGTAQGVCSTGYTQGSSANGAVHKRDNALSRDSGEKKVSTELFVRGS